MIHAPGFGDKVPEEAWVWIFEVCVGNLDKQRVKKNSGNKEKMHWSCIVEGWPVLRSWELKFINAWPSCSEWEGRSSCSVWQCPSSPPHVLSHAYQEDPSCGALDEHHVSRALVLSYSVWNRIQGLAPSCTRLHLAVERLQGLNSEALKWSKVRNG